MEYGQRAMNEDILWMAKRAKEIMMLWVVESTNEAIYGMKSYDMNVFVFLFHLCARQKCFWAYY